MIKYSPSLPDQCGSQIHDDLFAYAYCHNNGFNYGGSCHSNWIELRTELCKYLSLPIPSTEYVPNLEHKQYREDQCGLEINQIFNKRFLEHIRSKCIFSNEPKKDIISVHIRRGDVDCNEGWKSERYLSPEYYVNILDILVKKYPNYKVVIYSQYNFWNESSYYEKFNPELKIETPIIETWADIITSKVFVMSKSSFSYVPALFNSGQIVYTPFWHKPLNNWIDVGKDDWTNKLM